VKKTNRSTSVLEFFAKNVGLVGLVTVINFLVIFYLVDKLQNIEERLMVAERNASSAENEIVNMSAPEVEEVKENLTSIIRNDQEKIEDLEHRLNLLYSAIVPFLDNLCKNPEKSTIHWPNRVEKIQEYNRKLKLIVEGKAR
jgi:hypothetical protein